MAAKEAAVRRGKELGTAAGRAEGSTSTLAESGGAIEGWAALLFLAATSASQSDNCFSLHESIATGEVAAGGSVTALLVDARVTDNIRLSPTQGTQPAVAQLVSRVTYRGIAMRMRERAGYLRCEVLGSDALIATTGTAQRDCDL